METILGDEIGTTIGIRSIPPLPSKHQGVYRSEVKGRGSGSDSPLEVAWGGSTTVV